MHFTLDSSLPYLIEQSLYTPYQSGLHTLTCIVIVLHCTHYMHIVSKVLHDTESAMLLTAIPPGNEP